MNNRGLALSSVCLTPILECSSLSKPKHFSVVFFYFHAFFFHFLPSFCVLKVFDPPLQPRDQVCWSETDTVSIFPVLVTLPWEWSKTEVCFCLLNINLPLIHIFVLQISRTSSTWNLLFLYIIDTLIISDGNFFCCHLQWWGFWVWWSWFFLLIRFTLQWEGLFMIS